MCEMREREGALSECMCLRLCMSECLCVHAFVPRVRGICVSIYVCVFMCERVLMLVRTQFLP